MAYEFDPVASKVQPAEAPVGKAPLGASKAASGQAKYIQSYKSAGYWSLFNSPNRVRIFQEFFRLDKSTQPVFLRGGRDVLMYRSVMILSLVGLGITIGGIYKMAVGTMKKKGAS